jgi:hypothetical protein
MPLGSAYATLSQLKKRVGVHDPSDTEHDVELLSALAAASEGIEDYCNRQFNNDGVATPRIFDEAYGKTLFVDDFYDDDIVVRTVYRDGSYGYEWQATDFQIEPLNGLVRGRPFAYYRLRAYDRHWCDSGIGWDTRIEVTAKWGWASVPANVSEACLILAAEKYMLKDAPLGIAGFNQGIGTIRVKKNPIACEMLHRYVRNRSMFA